MSHVTKFLWKVRMKIHSCLNLCVSACVCACAFVCAHIFIHVNINTYTRTKKTKLQQKKRDLWHEHVGSEALTVERICFVTKQVSHDR